MDIFSANNRKDVEKTLDFMKKKSVEVKDFFVQDHGIKLIFEKLKHASDAKDNKNFELFENFFKFLIKGQFIDLKILRPDDENLLFHLVKNYNKAVVRVVLKDMEALAPEARTPLILGEVSENNNNANTNTNKLIPFLNAVEVNADYGTSKTTMSAMFAVIKWLQKNPLPKNSAEHQQDIEAKKVLQETLKELEVGYESLFSLIDKDAQEYCMGKKTLKNTAVLLFNSLSKDPYVTIDLFSQKLHFWLKFYLNFIQQLPETYLTHDNILLLHTVLEKIMEEMNLQLLERNRLNSVSGINSQEKGTTVKGIPFNKLEEANKIFKFLQEVVEDAASIKLGAQQVSDVDLRKYPSIRKTNYSQKEITIGDLHGNSLYLSYFLISIGVMSLPNGDEDYKRLFEIYKTTPPTLKTASQFQGILKFAKFNKHSVGLIRFIGDILADRGSCDGYTLYILHLLKKAGVNFEILDSNHDKEFYRNRNNLQDAKSQLIIGGHAKSLKQLSNLVKEDKDYLTAVSDWYQEAYLPNLKLISFSIKGDKPNQCLEIYTHAPVNFTIIFDVAKELGIKFDENKAGQNIETFIDLITGMNHVFAEKVKDGSILDFHSEEEIGKGYGQHDDKCNALTKMIWGRTPKAAESKDVKFSFKLINGHHEDFNAENYINLDGQLGKLPQARYMKGDLKIHVAEHPKSINRLEKTASQQLVKEPNRPRSRKISKDEMTWFKNEQPIEPENKHSLAESPQQISSLQHTLADKSFKEGRPRSIKMEKEENPLMNSNASNLNRTFSSTSTFFIGGQRHSGLLKPSTSNLKQETDEQPQTSNLGKKG